ncbi:PAB-dependent poly(A)-specific ribonuclease subunit 3, partial [Cladochytrium tenue]
MPDAAYRADSYPPHHAPFYAPPLSHTPQPAASPDPSMYPMQHDVVHGNPYLPQASRSDSSYFYANYPAPRQPLQYHMYSASMAHVNNVLPQQRTVQSFFISDTLREDLTRQNEALMAAPDPSGSQDNAAGSFSYPSHVYKATSSADGCCYVLRRIE